MLGRRGKLSVACFTVADRLKRGTVLLLWVREEKSFHHSAMVAKFLDDCFKLSLVKWNLTVKCWQNLLGLNPKRPYLNLEKEKFCVVFTHSIEQVHEIRMFHVAVVQQKLRNVQKSELHMQSCCFANRNLSLFCCSYCHRCHCCSSSLLMCSRNFATMVMRHHTSPLYWI